MGTKLSAMRRVAVGVVVLGLLVSGCGDATPEQPSKPLSPEQQASAYARQISGGSYKYGGIGAAAMSGCLEALLDEHVGIPGRSYRDEFPESGLRRIYRKAKRDCG